MGNRLAWGVARSVRSGSALQAYVTFFALVLSLALLVRPAAAQVLFGSMVGNVTDSTGAGVPGAVVKVTEMQTNESRTAVTNEAGTYTISTVPAGTYQVEVTKTGFRAFLTSNILVNQNNVVRVDARLEVGAQSEKIEVTAEAALLQTDRADIHAEVATQALENLPQPTRTYEGLLNLVPGAIISTGSQLSGGTNNPSKAMQFEFNGTTTSGAQVRVEGVSSNNPWQYYNASYVPSIEAVQNVNVATNSNDAEQALAGGAAVNVMLKSGTNETHGAVYAYNVNSKFEANNFFAAAGSKPPPLNDNNDGANVGGHVIRNKLFYFGSYEGDYSHSATSGLVSFPPQALLGGNLSVSPNPIYNPFTGAANGTGKTPFPGNIIPASLLNPIDQKIAALIPAAPVVPGLVNNLYLNLPAVYNLHKIDTKADFVPNSKLHISGRYGTQPYYATFAPMYGPILGGSGGPGADPCGACNYLQHGATYTISGSATYVATPTFVIDTTFGTVHPHQLLYPTETNVNYGSQVLGLQGTNTGPLPWAGGVPNFVISNFNTMGYSYPALDYIQPSYEYNANASKIKGAHTIRFGTDIFKIEMNHIEISPTAFSFTGGATALNGGPSPNAYNALADFLLGEPTSEANYTQTAQPYLTLRTWDFAIYARDQWQVSKKITINYGLRWEYYPVPMQANKGINLYNPATNIIDECGVGGISSTCGITVSHRLFAPNFGIAYRAFKDFVVRAGFSLSPFQNEIAQAGMKSFPQEVGAIFNGPNSYTAYQSVSLGVPIVTAPAPTNGQIFVPAGTGNIFTVMPNIVRGYAETFNVTVQKEFSGGWTAQAGWVGTHSVHEDVSANINYGQLGGGAASQPLDQYGITASTSQVQPFGSDIYHSLQASLRKRLSNGLMTQLAYTFSKDITDTLSINIPQYRWKDRYISSLDRTQALVWSTSYELPFGHNKQWLQHGLFSQIVGGWSLNGLFTHYSGLPFTVSTSSASCNCPGNSQTANQILPNVAIVGNGLNGNPYFNPLAYGAVTTAAFGTSGFDQLFGPGATNLDMNIFRDFRVTERFHVQARAESFNLTNTPHFANPGATASNLQLNSDGSIKSLNGFSQITSTTPLGRLIDPRYFRFGLRFQF
jgi:hypothetical protein